jgi:hypothetical protein
MSSLAIPREAAQRRAARRALPAVFSLRGSDVLLTVAVLGLAAVLLAELTSSFDVDSWLELVAGRNIWQHGLPHHETLTVIAHGRLWIDQQWLSQLASYGLYRLGGLGFLGVVNVGLIVAAVGGALVGARRLGAQPKAVMAMLALGLVMIVPSRQVRTQEFAMPLFVALTYLLATDSRSPSRRVYWCLPILVLWANLHGTVTLGAMLVALRGATVAWERRARLSHSLREWRRPLALGLGGPLCLLLTPYGLHIVAYYRATMLSSTLQHTVSEWQPITSVPLTAAVFFLMAGIAVWSFGRHGARTTLWERIALLVLAAGSIDVIRNILFFGLFAMIVMPVSLGSVRAAAVAQAHHWRGAVNAALAGVAVLAALFGVAVTVLRPQSAFELHYQRLGVLSAVERATTADPSIKVFAEDRFDDWLLWRDPGLGGRLANDVRFELLTGNELDSLNRVFGVIGPGWKRAARGYRLIVLDRNFVPDAVRAFTVEPGSRVLYDVGGRVVILRSAQAAS